MRKNVFIGIISVLLVVGIGVSLAYFVSEVLLTGSGANVSGTTADLIKVTYDAGTAKLTGNNLVPGGSATKEFSVTVTPTVNEKEATYAIYLDITNNTFVKCDDTNFNSITNNC